MLEMEPGPKAIGRDPTERGTCTVALHNTAEARTPGDAQVL